jgi:hypothetical protein
MVEVGTFRRIECNSVSNGDPIERSLTESKCKAAKKLGGKRAKLVDHRQMDRLTNIDGAPKFLGYYW